MTPCLASLTRTGSGRRCRPHSDVGPAGHTGTVTRITITCPGLCGWTLDDDLTTIQDTIDGDLHVTNGLVDPVKATTVVDVVVTWHVEDCPQLRQWLRGRRINPAGVVAANPWRQPAPRTKPAWGARHG